MSLHTAGIVITGIDINTPEHTLNILGLLGTKSDDGTLIGEALSFTDKNCLALTSIGHWNFIFGSSLFMPMTDIQNVLIPDGPGFWNILIQRNLDQLSLRGAKIFGFIAEGASMTYGFEWYDNYLRRRYLEVDGDCLIEEGERLIHEDAALNESSDWERRIWFIMEPLTLPFDRPNQSTFFKFKNVKGFST